VENRKLISVGHMRGKDKSLEKCIIQWTLRGNWAKRKTEHGVDGQRQFMGGLQKAIRESGQQIGMEKDDPHCGLASERGQLKARQGKSGFPYKG